MLGNTIPATHHLARHIAARHITEDGQAILASAFPWRSGEEYLSFNWLEYYSGGYAAQVTAVVAEVKNCRRVKPNDRFGTFEIEKLTKRCTDARVSIEVHHEPVFEPCPLPSHSGIYDLSNEHELLAEIIAGQLKHLHFPNSKQV